MRKFIDKANSVLMYIGMALAGGVMFCTFIDVFNRLAVRASLGWPQRTAVWLNIGVIFLVAPVMLIQGGHIRVLFIYNKLKGLTKKITDTINELGVVFYTGLVVWVGVSYVAYLIRQNIKRSLGTMYVPYWIVGIIVPVGMSIMLTWALYMLVSGVRNRLKETPEVTEGLTSDELEEKEESD